MHLNKLYFGIWEPKNQLILIRTALKVDDTYSSNSSFYSLEFC